MTDDTLVLIIRRQGDDLPRIEASLCRYAFSVAFLLSIVFTSACATRVAPASQPVPSPPQAEEPQVGLGVTTSGVSSWLLGMSPRQVFIQPDCKPFLPVRVTGGIECPNFITPIGERTISFEFEEEVLSKIQVRLYQGASEEEWASTLWRSIEILDLDHQITQDQLTSTTIGDEAMGDARSFVSRLTELTRAGLPISLTFLIDPHLSQRRWISAIYNPRGVASVYLFVGRE